MSGYDRPLLPGTMRHESETVLSRRGDHLRYLCARAFGEGQSRLVSIDFRLERSDVGKLGRDRSCGRPRLLRIHVEQAI